jgi:cysteine desulfuration protein SufE
MPTIAEIEKELVEEFALFDDWEGKYEYIIDIGKKLPPLDGRYKTEVNRIKGCQSTVWMHSYAKDGRVYYEADSDAVIVKGLVSMLIRVFSGQPARDIVDAPIRFLDEIGMTRHLAQTRSNGLLAMIRQMKLDALAWSSDK